MIVPVSYNSGPLICRLLLLLLIFSVLLKSSLFVNTFYTHLFAYTFTSCIVITISGIYLLKKGCIALSPLSLIMLLLTALWAVYIFCADRLFSTAGPGGTLQSYYLATSLISCFSIVLLLQTSAQNIRQLFLAILAVAIIQAGICLLQLSGIMATENDFFTVTGTWLNPNIAAMYIALALPVVLYHVLCNASKRKLYIPLLLLMLLALVLLKSRTALLGAILMMLIMVQWRYAVFQQFLKRLSGRVKTVVLTVVIFLTVLAGYFVYNLKKESADSRRFIWKTGLAMIAQKPFTGYGYGTFERNYNLFQAATFSTNTVAESDKQNAAHTKMGYNEFLQNAIEGGIAGVAFLLLLLFLLLRSAFLYLKRNNALHYQKKHIEKDNSNEIKCLLIAATGIAGLCLMSLVNFTILTVPVMSIFIVYAAVIIYTTSLSGSIAIHPTIIKITATGLIITGLMLGVKTAKMVYSQHIILKAVNLAVDKQYDEAINTLEQVTEKYRDNADYCQTLGNTQYFNNNKAGALAAYKKAAEFTSSPEIYQQMGNCYAAMQQYNEAVIQYEIAKYIQPNRITPRYLLMTAYIKLRDSANTLRLAKEILLTDEKVPSPQITMYKKTASNIIKKIQQKNSL
jgi:O-antigen polymerase